MSEPKAGSSGDDGRIKQMLEAIDARTLAIGQELDATKDRLDQLSGVMSAVAGLDGVAVGIGQIVEMLEPLRNLAPASIAGPIATRVAVAIAETREALARHPERPGYPDRLPIVDQPVLFIGEARPAAVGPYQLGAQP